MAVDIDALITTLEAEKGNWTTYTLNEVKQLGDRYKNEQHEATGSLGQATVTLKAAKATYLQAVKDYKAAFATVNSKIQQVQVLMGYSGIDQLGGPPSLGHISTSPVLMQVSHNEAVNA